MRHHKAERRPQKLDPRVMESAMASATSGRLGGEGGHGTRGLRTLRRRDSSEEGHDLSQGREKAG